MNNVLRLNWRRGLLRAWVVCAAAWWLFALANIVRIWLLYPAGSIADTPISIYVEAFGLPLVVLAAGYIFSGVASWVVKGFRP